MRPALAFRMMYPDSRISFLCDAGKGHFDLCEETQRYMALFIAKALKNPRSEGGIYYPVGMPTAQRAAIRTTSSGIRMKRWCI